MAQALFTVSGAKEIIKVCEDLEPKVSKLVAKPLVKRAAKKIEAALKANTPVDKGALRKSVKVRTSKGPQGWRRSRNVVAFGVLVGQGKELTKKQTAAVQKSGSLKAAGIKVPYYAFMQEKGYHLGHRVRQGMKTVGYKATKGNLGAQGVRYMPGRHFVKRTMKSQESSIMQQMLLELSRGIEAAAAGKG